MASPLQMIRFLILLQCAVVTITSTEQADEKQHELKRISRAVHLDFANHYDAENEDHDDVEEEEEEEEEDRKIKDDLHDSIEKIAKAVVDEIRKRWKRRRRSKGNGHFPKHYHKSIDNRIEIISADEKHTHNDAVGHQEKAKDKDHFLIENIDKQAKHPVGKNAIEANQKDNKIEISEKQAQIEAVGHHQETKKVSLINSNTNPPLHIPIYKNGIKANEKDNEQVATVQYELNEKKKKLDSEKNVDLYKTLLVETTTYPGNRTVYSSNTAQNEGDAQRVFGLNQFEFIVIIVSCCVTAVVGFIAAFICWYRLGNNTKHMKGFRAVLPSEKDLAQGAEVFHYMTTKKVLQKLENPSDVIQCLENDGTDSSDHGSDCDEVLSCSGLAIPGNLSIVNPFFSDQEAYKSDYVNQGGSSNPSVRDNEEDTEIEMEEVKENEEELDEVVEEVKHMMEEEKEEEKENENKIMAVEDGEETKGLNE